jgi:hypothetical protein
MLPPCPLLVPANAVAGGGCGSSLPSGDSCSFTCASGFVLDSPSTICSLDGLATVQRCEPASRFLIVAPLEVSFEHPPSSIAASDQLNLQASLVLDPLTAATPEWLRYEWHCSDPSFVLWNPALLAGPANSSSLTLRNGALVAGRQYVFTVHVMDTHPLHRVSSAMTAQPFAEASVTVAVTAALELTVAARTGVDPCAAQNPCLNGGRCIATLTAGASSYVLSCECRSTPFAFFGADCSFGVLACPGCVSSFAGGQQLTLLGVGLKSIRTITLAGKPVSFVSVTHVNASSSAAAASVLAQLGQPGTPSLDSISFRAPPIHVNETYSPGGSATALSRRLLDSEGSAPPSFPASYELLSVTAVPPSADKTMQINYTTLVFYTPSQCLKEGQWTDDGMGGCLSCPAGGYWSILQKRTALTNAHDRNVLVARYVNFLFARCLFLFFQSRWRSCVADGRLLELQ